MERIRIIIIQNGLLKYINSKLEEITGFTRQEAIEKPFTDFTAPEFRELVFNIYNKRLAGEEVNGKYEIEILSKHGRNIPIEINASVIEYQGKPADMAIMRDITERKRSEDMLRKSEALLNETQRFAKVGGGEYDVEKNKMTWTDEIYRIYGVSQDYDPNNKSLDFQFFDPEDKAIIERAYNDAVREGKPYDLTLKFTNAQGEHLWVRNLGQPELKDGRVVRVYGYIMDVTKSKQAEEELKKYREHLEKLVLERTREVRLAKEEAESANLAKTNFLRTMSHELRTPLNAILGFSKLLKMKTVGELNEKQEFFIDNVIIGGNNLLNIINQILEAVKMYEGTSELRIEKISVPETLDEIIGVIKEKATKKNVLLEKNLDPQLEHIDADKQKFKQVFINLLDNAVKFSKDEGGTVTINSKKEGDMAKFSVSDRGIGIREEDMEIVFQQFTQLDSGTTRKYGGTGIGLAITKQFVELLGGRIWVESKYGEGTTFSFLLPIEAKDNLCATHQDNY